MTNLQRATLRASEIRSKLNDFQAKDLTEDQIKEVDGLTNEYQTVEREIRMLTITEDEPVETRTESNEELELRSMFDRANVGNIFEAALNHGITEGVEKELQEHFNLKHNQVPVELLETRAVSTLPAQTSHTPGQANQAQILMPVFATGDAAYLGVSMPTVASGQSVYPVLTTRPTVGGPYTDSTSVSETTGRFTAEVLQPNRLQASFFYRRTDAAKFPMMDSALRNALSQGLSEALDQEVVDQIIADSTVVDTSTTDTFATYRKRLVYDNIDGRHAMNTNEIKLLVGSDTLTHMSGLYRANNSDDSVLDSINRISGGVRVSALLPETASNKQNCIARVGNRAGEAVAPIWQGVTIIPDEITKAATGEIVITAVLLAAFKVIRTDGYKLIATKHA